MPVSEKRIWARKTALEVHDSGAEWFHCQYASPENFYSSDFLYGRHQIDRYFREIIADLPPGSRILDVGCGTGDQLMAFYSLGFNVAGIEPSEKMRALAMTKLPAGIIQSGSILALPFPEASFECVHSLEVFRYLDHHDNVAGLHEIYRVLKPGGVFLGTFVNRYSLDGFFLLTVVREIMERAFGKKKRCHTEFETPQSLARKIRDAGFTEVRTHGAMVAVLRLLYKASQQVGERCARFLERYDRLLSDTPGLRPLAGHLVAIARK